MHVRGPWRQADGRTGVLLALAAAAAFGVFTPAAKGALARVDPVRGAGLAYLAAGLVAAGALAARWLSAAPPIGRPPARGDAPRLLGLVLFGGVLGPALFFAGIARIAAHQAAVLQHLEYALTVLAAVAVLGERPGRRGLAGLLLVGAGVFLLTWPGLRAPGPGAWSGAGAALVVAACAAWAVDNTLARGASDLDPLLVVAVKGLGAGSALALASGGPWDLGARGYALLLLAGGVGVGASLVLELLALRRIGAALNAGLFATGPAFGFLGSLVFLGEAGGTAAWVALALCLLGALALATDRHGHAHLHPAVRHAHRHHHRDGHHGHAHGAEVDPAAEHVHEHAHDPLRHAHDHVHGEDHRHRHGHGEGASSGG